MNSEQDAAPKKYRLFLGTTVIALVLVAAMVVWIFSTSVGTNAPTTASSASASAHASAQDPTQTSTQAPAPVSPHSTPPTVPTAKATESAGTGAPASSIPSSSAPSKPAKKDPKTGRVSTLGGLVPDFKLPPVINGMAPVITKIETQQKVVFLTIDDGAIKRNSDLALLQKQKIPASLFLAHTFVAGKADFYKQYLDAGYLIENHTMTHNLEFIQFTFEQQKAEICGMSDYAASNFGRRPALFRPPGGPYTHVTQQAAAACGIRAIVDWETLVGSGRMAFQVGTKLRPGDIVLMHFRPEFPQDLAAFVKAQKAAGLKVVLLEDYLGLR